MRSVLSKLEITPAPRFNELIDTAWRIHLVRKGGRESSVSTTTLLAASLVTDESVRSAFMRNGMRVEEYMKNIGASALPNTAKPVETPDFPVTDNVNNALTWYTQMDVKLALDAVGLTVALLRRMDERAQGRLVKAGLNVEAAVAALAQLFYRMAGPQYDNLPPIEVLKAYRLSETAALLADDARRLTEQYNAPLTTSVLVLAISANVHEQEGTTVADVGAAINGQTSPQELEKRHVEWMLWYRNGGGSVTRPVIAVFDRAVVLATATTGHEQIHARHLLGALFSLAFQGDIGVHDVLRWLQAPSQKSLLDTVADGVRKRVAAKTIADNLAAWEQELFGAAPEPFKIPIARHSMAVVSTDAVNGPDLLQFTRDAQAFAALIAAKNLKDNLSFGLFGNWGSGKSFFMTRLRDEVDSLAKKAGAAPDPKKTAFHSKIVQVPFNAWHYVEGNLWASLVEHIFRHLKVSKDEEESVTAERRQHYLAQIERTIAQRAEAEAAIRAAERQRAELAQQVQVVSATEVQLTAVLNVDAKNFIRLSEDEQRLMKDAAHTLGIDRLRKGIEDSGDVVREIVEAGGRVRQMLRWLWSGPGRTARIFAFVIALVLVPLVVWLVSTFTPLFAGNRDWPRYLGWIVSVLAVGTTYARVFLKGFNGVMSHIGNARDVARHALDEAQREKDQKLAALQAAVDAAQRAATDAQARVEQAQEEEGRAREELQRLTDRDLVSFIRGRIASDDYRKLLGVLAIVRNDFEELSRLMNDEAVAERAGEHRIDRIVLYIDDLDRCPPHYVRDVLQAVHLLLAFPLFIVVVGVDARWISRSLEREYRGQLRPERVFGVRSQFASGDATALDYLEKIFQIPFWIRPLSEESTKRLLTEWIEVRREEQKPPAPSPSPVPASAHAPPAPTPPPAPATAPPPPSDLVAGEDPLNPARVMVEQEELEAMHTLAPLIGRTPRSVKRFANIYRIVRAAKTPAELEAFLRRTNGLAPYECVLLLLGVITGASDLSRHVLIRIQTAAETDRVEDLGQRIRSNGPGKTEASVREWERACDALMAFGKRRPTSTAGDLQPYLLDISRFSFREPVEA